jgi:hypothetical protein
MVRNESMQKEEAQSQGGFGIIPVRNLTFIVPVAE